MISNVLTSRAHFVALLRKSIKRLGTMPSDFREKLPKKWQNYDFTNVVGLLLLMKEIQEREPLDDQNVLQIDEDGTRLY